MSVFHLTSSFIEYQTNSSMKKKKQLKSTTKTNKMKVISRKNCSVTEIKHPHDEDHRELEGSEQERSLDFSAIFERVHMPKFNYF